MVTRKVAGCGGTQDVKQWEMEEKMSKQQRMSQSGRDITQTQSNITPGGAASELRRSVLTYLTEKNTNPFKHLEKKKRGPE